LPQRKSPLKLPILTQGREVAKPQAEAKRMKGERRGKSGHVKSATEGLQILGKQPE
jgi:hypothetical protein